MSFVKTPFEKYKNTLVANVIYKFTKVKRNEHG